MSTESVKILKPKKDAVYPRIKYWETEIHPNKRLKIVNEGDYPIKELISSIGLDNSEYRSLTQSFGISDEDEIRRRLGIMRLFHENPKLTSFILHSNKHDDLPINHEDFLDYYDAEEHEHNHYWRKVYKFLELLNKSKDPIPESLVRVKQALIEALHLEKTEFVLGEAIKKEITKITKLEGTANFCISIPEPVKTQNNEGEADKVKVEMPKPRLSLEDSTCHGYRQFSTALSRAKRSYLPRWTKKWWAYLFGLRLMSILAVALMNKWHILNAMKSMVVKYASDSLINDIQKAVEKKLEKLKLNAHDRVILNDAIVKTYFRYDERGLTIRITGLDSLGDDHLTIQFQLCQWDGYDKKMRDEIHVLQKKMDEDLIQSDRLVKVGKLYHNLDKGTFGLFGVSFCAPSPSADVELRWFALENFYASRRFKQGANALRKNRKFLNDQLRQLYPLANLMRKFQFKAREIGSPLCIPEIVNNGEHIIHFGDLYPVQLLFSNDRPDKIYPVSGVPMLNGEMIGVSGVNAGGKTVILKSILALIYLAQSGLPIFGTGIRMNVKKVAGGVFVPKTDGSTAKQLLEKTKNLLKATKGLKGHKVVLVIDEIGTGTQEDAGYDYGTRLLKTLQARGVSLIFSTQITRLLETAEKNFDAHCVKLGKDHKVTPGIGVGNLSNLVEEVGLSKMLH